LKLNYLNNKMKNKIVAFLLALTILNPALVMAQTPTPASGNALPAYSGVEGSIKEFLCTPAATPQGMDLANCINKMYRFGIAIGGIALVFFLVVAGYMYITGGETGKQKGKAVLRNALVGMAILLGSYLLLGFVNPELTRFKPINPPVFNDPKLPGSCEDIGLPADCIVPTDPTENENQTPGSPTNRYANCTSGLVPVAGIPKQAGATTICSALLDKVKVAFATFRQQNPGYYAVATSTVRNWGQSDCHYSNKPVTGNCVDTVLRTSAGAKVPSTNQAWGALCRVYLGMGMDLANESGGNFPGCRPARNYGSTTGNNIHVFIPGN
jgi:hypothetical protein